MCPKGWSVCIHGTPGGLGSDVEVSWALKAAAACPQGAWSVVINGYNLAWLQ